MTGVQTCALPILMASLNQQTCSIKERPHATQQECGAWGLSFIEQVCWFRDAIIHPHESGLKPIGSATIHLDRLLRSFAARFSANLLKEEQLRGREVGTRLADCPRVGYSD